MKVILTTDVMGLGEVGDTCEVKPGYARNFLIPQNLAMEFTPYNQAVIDSRKKKIQKKLELEKLSALEQKEKLSEIVLKINKKAGESDVLFGSVTSAEIEGELAKIGVHIERKKIHLDEPIKRLGNYTCHLRLFRDVEAEIHIEVHKEGETEISAP